MSTKRLNINLDSELFKLVKAKASLEDKSLREYTQEALEEKMNKSAGIGDQADEIRKIMQGRTAR